MRYFRSPKTQNKILHLVKNQIPLIVFDTETTGLNKDDKIIQLYARKVIFKPSGYNTIKIEEIDSFETYINPQWSLPQAIIDITHITDDDLKDQPTEDEIIDKITEFFGDNSYIAAYNAMFDLDKMNEMYKRCGRQFKAAGWIDILDTVRDFYKRMPVTVKSDKKITPYQLCNVTHTLGLDENIDFHKADQDVEATIRILEVCVNHYLQDPMVDGTDILRVKSVSFYDNAKIGHTERRINIGTDRGLVYYNTYYRYFASTEIDLRFINVNQLEDDVCKIAEVPPYELFRFKRREFAK